MDRLYFLIVFLLCFGCNSSNKLPFTITSDSGDSIKHEYLKILDGLKREYVLYYRNQKRFGTDLKAFGMQTSDSIFKIDSVKYFESYQNFFRQNYHFIDWLLKFKNDTTKAGLWQKYLDPHSSYIGECHLPMSNSRAAANLLENFLNGSGFQCYECKQDDLDCSTKKYEEIEKFLDLHKEKGIDILRNEWIRNAR